jgi:hypothetical protein
LHNGFAPGEVGGSDSEGGSGDHRQTDWHADDKEDERIDEKVVLARRGDPDASEEGSDPDNEDEEDDKDEEGRSDAGQDDLEVASLVGIRYQLGGASDEGLLGGYGNDGVALASLDAAGVVGDVSDKFVNGEGLSGNGRLVDGAE